MVPRASRVHFREYSLLRCAMPASAYVPGCPENATDESGVRNASAAKKPLQSVRKCLFRLLDPIGFVHVYCHRRPFNLLRVSESEIVRQCGRSRKCSSGSPYSCDRAATKNICATATVTTMRPLEASALSVLSILLLLLLLLCLLRCRRLGNLTGPSL